MNSSRTRFSSSSTTRRPRCLLHRHCPEELAGADLSTSCCGEETTSDSAAMGVAPAVAVFSSKIHLRNVHRRPGGNFERGGERLGVGFYNGGGSWGRQTLAFNSLNPLLISPRTSSKLEFVQRTSIDEVRKEMQSCYELIQRLGRGVVYFGSSRLNDDHPHFLQAVEFARDVARLLECTTWTGAGPGLMDAAIKGALEARMPVGGLKIAMEASERVSSNQHPYLPSEKYLTCRFISARKYGLANAVARNESSDLTAVVAFPGGIGTLDEVFEILALIQLKRIGSELPVPFLLMNYDSFYSKLLEFMDECEKRGTVARGEVTSLLKVCNGNSEALKYLSEFYNIPQKLKEF